MESKTCTPSTQEDFILQALAKIQKVILFKLGSLHENLADDLKQRIFYKIWLWKCRNNKVLTLEGWQKIINVTVNTEIAEFFSEKYHREILLSHFDEYVQEKVFTSKYISYKIDGNSETEIRSILLLIWKEAKNLTLRQRYAFFLADSDLLIEFVYCNCCSTKELANCFEMSEEEISDFLNELPITNEKIAMMLETKIKRKISPNQLWEARAKAKAKLKKAISEYFNT